MIGNSIAIIIPCFNGWKYFSRCLKSLENQTIKPDEIIIVDDCSTDDSYLQLCEYSQNSILPITVFRNAQNVGPSLSRRNALAKVTSQYVCFCDCDDWYELNFVEEMKRQLECKNADLIIFDNYKVVNEKKEKAQATRILISGEKKEIIANYQMSLWRLVVKKELFSNVEFPDLYHGEDGVAACQIIIHADNIVVLQEAYYNYLYRENSASKTISKSSVYELIDAYNAKKKFMNDAYTAELEYIGIKDVLYGAVLNACKAKMKRCEINRIIADFLLDFPLCMKNPYLKNYSRSKKWFVKFASCHWISICKILSDIHSRIT